MTDNDHLPIVEHLGTPDNLLAWRMSDYEVETAASNVFTTLMTLEDILGDKSLHEKRSEVLAHVFQEFGYLPTFDMSDDDNTTDRKRQRGDAVHEAVSTIETWYDGIKDKDPYRTLMQASLYSKRVIAVSNINRGMHKLSGEVGYNDYWKEAVQSAHDIVQAMMYEQLQTHPGSTLPSRTQLAEIVDILRGTHADPSCNPESDRARHELFALARDMIADHQPTHEIMTTLRAAAKTVSEAQATITSIR